MASELAYEASDEASENELLDKSLSVWKGWNSSFIDEDFSPVKIDIHTASSIGQYESVRSLINKGGVDIDKRNRGGWTPLMYASYIGHDAIAKLLIDAECDLNMKNNKGQTPLMLAASCGNEGVGHLLVKHEAELESIDKKGWTALFHATNSGHQNFVRFLIASGANMDAVVSYTGVTPLMEAAAEGHEIIVQLLLQYGVNVNAKTYNGDMARSVALINGYMKIVSLIDNHLMPITNHRQADFSSSDEFVRRPRPQLIKGSKSKLRGGGPSIRDGPEAIARLIDRSKVNTNTQLNIPNSCVPKGYVTFPQGLGDQGEVTPISYRDVTSPINPEDYTLDSSGGKESYDNEDDSNAFSKTGAITIKSSSSSSGGLVAALGLSRDNSVESDDLPLNINNKNIHPTNSNHKNMPIETLTPSSSCDEETGTNNQKQVTGSIPQADNSEQRKFEHFNSNSQCYNSRDQCGVGLEQLTIDCDKRQDASLVPCSNLDTNFQSVSKSLLEHGQINPVVSSQDTRDSGISTNDGDDYGIALPYMRRISNPLPTHLGTMPQPAMYGRPTTHAMSDQASGEIPSSIYYTPNNAMMSEDANVFPPLLAGGFPGQPVIPPTYPPDLQTLLKSHGLSKYMSLFDEQDVDLTVFLSLTDNDLKEIGVKLFGPRKKMTNAIARWHSNAPVLSSGLESVYADRIEGEMQEMAIQLNQAYNNVDQLKAQIQQEKQLRSVTEGCLLDQQDSWHNIHHIVMDTKKRSDNMKEKLKKFKISINDLKELNVKNGHHEKSSKDNKNVKPSSGNKSKDRSSMEYILNKLDKYTKDLSQNVTMVTMNCDQIFDKCANSRNVNTGYRLDEDILQDNGM